MTRSSEPLISPAHAFAKRSLDLGIALPMTLLLLPFLALLLVVTRIVQGSPVFFLHPRVGRGGSKFRLIKIRTMREGAGPGVTAADDPRITRWGAFLRRHRLDELPQLFQVLSGTLSLVGPRPEIPEYVARWEPRHRALLALRPGLCDPATLAALDEERELEGRAAMERYYLDVVMPRKLEASLRYFQRATLPSDLGVVLRLPLALIRR